MVVYSQRSCLPFIGVLIQLVLCSWITYAYKVWSCPPWADGRVTAPVRHGEHCLLHTTSGFTASWTTAQSFCSQNGGMLAKDDTDERNKLMGRLLASNDKCSWIALTDKGTRGKWRWNDGSRLTLTRWERGEVVFSWIYDLAHDGGALCYSKLEFYLLGSSDSAWYWIKERCSRKLPFVCQYDAVGVEMQVSEYTETLVIELPAMKDFRLGGSPDWSISARAVTGCARRCKASTPQCLVFNYNKATRQCEGYRSIPTEGCVRAKGWTLWKLIGKKRY